MSPEEPQFHLLWVFGIDKFFMMPQSVMDAPCATHWARRFRSSSVMFVLLARGMVVVSMVRALIFSIWLWISCGVSNLVPSGATRKTSSVGWAECQLVQQFLLSRDDRQKDIQGHDSAQHRAHMDVGATGTEDLGQPIRSRPHQGKDDDKEGHAGLTQPGFAQGIIPDPGDEHAPHPDRDGSGWGQVRNSRINRYASARI